MNSVAHSGIRGFRVVKMGGSLLNKPGLISRLQSWLAELKLYSALLVIGGGGAADWIRRLDQVHHLPTEVAHWLAIESMRLNARCLASLLAQAEMVRGFRECEITWAKRQMPILDPVAFCQWDVTLPDGLPIGWEVTSDSIAGQAAWRWQAEELVLVKSCPKPCGDWQAIAQAGAVDAYFPKLAQRLPSIRWLCWGDAVGGNG